MSRNVASREVRNAVDCRLSELLEIFFEKIMPSAYADVENIDGIKSQPIRSSSE